MKTNIHFKNVVKMTMSMVLFSTVVFTTTSFNSKDDSPKNQNDEYIYLLAYPSGGSNSSINNYISEIIHYQGQEACSKYNNSREFFAEAGKKFMESIEKYRKVDIGQWRISYIDGNRNGSSFPSESFRGFASKEDALESKKEKKLQLEINTLEYQLENWDYEFEVYETRFTYECN